MSPQPNSARQRAGSPPLLFVASSVWIIFAMIAGRAAAALVPAPWYDLCRYGVIAGLLFGGFYLIARNSIADMRPLSSIGFVRRPSAPREFGLGLALGWGIALALVLPALLTRNLRLAFSFDAASLQACAVGVLVLLAFGVVVQLVLGGLPMRLLVRSTGTTWAVCAAIFVSVLLAVQTGPNAGRNVLFVALLTSLFCAAFFRTRALWTSLGLQVGWMLVQQLVFGTPSAYTPATGGIVQSSIGGASWLTGGLLGPETSLWAVLVLIAALVVLFRVTRDYAWHYTYQPITGAGYPMDVPPPAEHVREEQRAVAPLVQIGGIGQPLSGASLPGTLPGGREQVSEPPVADPHA